MLDKTVQSVTKRSNLTWYLGGFVVYHKTLPRNKTPTVVERSGTSIPMIVRPAKTTFCGTAYHETHGDRVCGVFRWNTLPHN